MGSSIDLGNDAAGRVVGVAYDLSAHVIFGNGGELVASIVGMANMLRLFWSVTCERTHWPF